MNPCSKLTNRWLLDGSAASTSGNTVIDSIGNWNGVAYGGYSYNNGAVYLDGNSGYIDLGSHFFGGSMSIAFWSTVITFNSWQRFFDWATGSFNNPYGNIVLCTGDTSTGSSLTFSVNGANWNPSGIYFPLKVWNHFVITLDSSGNYVIYMNGKSVYSSSSVPADVIQRTHMYLGKIKD